MSAQWQKSFEIVWEGDLPPDGVEEKVRADMLENLSDLAKPSDLIMHTVWLGEDIHGPSAFIWGRKRDRRFRAEYATHTEFETLTPSFPLPLPPVSEG